MKININEAKKKRKFESSRLFELKKNENILHKHRPAATK